MYFEFWKHFSLFTFWKKFVNKKNATKIQNIVFIQFGISLRFATIKVVGEPKKQNLISAKKFVKRTGCLQPTNSLVQGFFHGCGFNSSGMMLGAGAGKELANWIVDGRPEFDLYG